MSDPKKRTDNPTDNPALHVAIHSRGIAPGLASDAEAAEVAALVPPGDQVPARTGEDVPEPGEPDPGEKARRERIENVAAKAREDAD